MRFRRRSSLSLFQLANFNLEVFFVPATSGKRHVFSFFFFDFIFPSGRLMEFFDFMFCLFS